MSRLKELIDEFCPDGVEYAKFSSVCQYVRGVTYNKSQEAKPRQVNPQKVLRANNITLSSNTLNFEDVKLVSSSVRIKKDQFLYQGDILICAGSGSKEHIGKVAYIDSDMDYSFGGFMAVIRCEERLSSRFLFHILTGENFKTYLAGALNSTTINNLNFGVIKDFRIPVPPAEIQREIVRILDKFSEKSTELCELLSAEMIARKKQYEYYREKLLTFGDDVDRRSLREMCHITTGKLNVNEKDENGQYPFFTCDEKPYRINKYAFDTTAILISGNGSRVGHINLYSGKFNAYQRTYVLSDFEEIDIKFLYQYLKGYLKSYIVSNSRKASIPYITLPMLSNFEIPLPPLSEQKRIADILDRFDLLCNDLSSGIPAEIAARKKQYEYYRDRLLTFREKI